MYRRPRRRPWRGWLMAVAAACVLGAVIFGVIRAVSGAPDLDRDAKMLPTSNPDGIFPWKGGVLCVETNQLYCTDAKGATLWQTALPAENMKVARTGNLTVAWGNKMVALIDEKGTVINTWLMNGDVVLAAAGSSTFAVVTKEEDQNRLRFYPVSGKDPIDERSFTYENIMGMGFIGAKLDQLWYLTVDSNGTHPVTKLTIYVPGKNFSGKMMGVYTLTDELAYAAFVEDKITCIVSTHTLSYWEHSGAITSSKLVYGWTLQDALEESGRVSFLFAPSGSGDSDQISALWYIGGNGAEYRIPLPAGCIKAVLKSNGRICVVTKNGVYTMAQNGSGSRFYPISSSVDSIPAVVPGEALVVQEKHRNYLINMP